MVPFFHASNELSKRASVAQFHGDRKGTAAVACPVNQLGNILELTVIAHLVMIFLVAVLAVRLAGYAFPDVKIVWSSARTNQHGMAISSETEIRDKQIARSFVETKRVC